MCDPTSAIMLGSLALSAVGTMQQAQAASSADQAQAAAIRGARTEQAQTARDTTRVVDNTREAVARPQMEAATTAATNVREAAARAAAAPPADYLPGQDSAPQIVRDEVDRRRALGQQFVNQQIGARANLGGWTDALQGARMQVGRGVEDITTQGSFARGEAGLLPLSLNAARIPDGGTSTLGNLLVGAGQLGASGAFNRLGGLFSTGPVKTPTTAATNVASIGRLAGPV